MNIELFFVLLSLAVVTVAKKETFADLVSVLERVVLLLVVEVEVLIVVGSVGNTCLSFFKSNGSRI